MKCFVLALCLIGCSEKQIVGTSDDCRVEYRVYCSEDRPVVECSDGSVFEYSEMFDDSKKPVCSK